LWSGISVSIGMGNELGVSVRLRGIGVLPRRRFVRGGWAGCPIGKSLKQAGGKSYEDFRLSEAVERRRML